jgi:hypothetical protein
MGYKYPLRNILPMSDLYPVHLLVIPMYICTSQSLFSHSYVLNVLNRHCNVQIDIGIREDELDISHSYYVENECLNRHCDVQIDIGISAQFICSNYNVYLYIAMSS